MEPISVFIEIMDYGYSFSRDGESKAQELADLGNGYWNKGSGRQFFFLPVKRMQF